MLSGCATLNPRAECAAHGGDTWHEARSEHFRVWTDLDADEARGATVALERTRAMMRLWWGDGTDFDPPGTVDVVLLRRQGALSEFADNRVGGYVSWQDTNVRMLVVMAHEKRRGIPKLVRHELAHYLSRFVLLRQPRWFAEGLAMYLEVAEERRDGMVELGQDNKTALDTVLRMGALPLASLWAWDTSEPPVRDRFHYYASSWAWVHFLLNSQAERFADYQQRLARAEPPRLAWDAAFEGMSDEALEQEFAKALRHGTEYTIVTRKLPPASTDVTLGAMSAADVHVTRARLHRSAFGGTLTPAQRQVQAQADVAEALRLEPGHVHAAVLGAVMEEDGAKRLARARALTAAHPASAEAWDLLGDSLGEETSARVEREQARRNALRLTPEEPARLAALAREYTANGRHANALAHAVKAAKLAPWSQDVQATLAVAAAAQGRCAEAQVAQARAVDLQHESVSSEQRAAFHEWLASRIRVHCAAAPEAPPSAPEAPATR
ncbi:hypothetical protein A176_004898 [Myxococcus hansupus]|uniref:DUF1570 domain-containing protein n=1 Tax=Pseudomyxococcus hansupus TaxID=1297742 RepID=A0A0H4WX77_9BACT|nr:hypothetical protein A176_004898 [Myxococcus hansupus]